METILEAVVAGLTPSSVLLAAAGTWVLAREAMTLPDTFEYRAREVEAEIDELYVELGHPDAPDEVSEGIDEGKRLRRIANQTERAFFGAGMLAGAVIFQVIRFVIESAAELSLIEWTAGLIGTTGAVVIVRYTAKRAGDRLRDLAREIGATSRRVRELRREEGLG
jgi:hypothetical protein